MQSILVNKTLEQIDAAPAVAHVGKAVETNGATAQRGCIPRALRAVQRGFTLIEVLIVIAIAAGMLVAVFTVANRVNTQSAISDFSSNMSLMATETRAAFRPQGTFAGVSPAALIGMGVVPPSMAAPPATINSAWGTAITVGPATVALPNDAVQFTVPNIPREQCAAVVASLEAAFSRITIDATNIKNMTPVAFGAMPANTVYQAATVGTACAAAPATGATAIFVMTR